MTRKDALDAERSAMEQRIGYYITPSRQAEMMRMAHKITKLMSDSFSGGYTLSYRESLIVLDMAKSGIRTILQWEETEL